MSESKSKTCGNCRVNQPVQDVRMLGSGALMCLRYPPQLVVIPHPHGAQVTSMYPTVTADAPACGEWDEKKTPAGLLDS